MSLVVNPNSISFESIRDDLIAYLDTKPDAAKWKDFFASQTGSTVVELIAGLGTMLRVQGVSDRRETFARYAKNRSSLIAYGESIGYSAFRGRNSILKLTIVPNFSGVVNKYQVVGQVKDLTLVALEDYTVNSGVARQITCVVGNLKTESLIAISEDPQSFRFKTPGVSQDLRVFKGSIEVPTSERIVDLINERFAIQSNVFGSVDVMYINRIDFTTRYSTGETIMLEYVELNNLVFNVSDVSFNFGILTTTEIMSVYEGPEDIEQIRINAPLYNETQFLIRGRKDYLKVFRLLDTAIVDTEQRDVSDAVVELFYVKNDLSLFSSAEKLAFIAKLSENRPMGIKPPLIGNANIVFYDLAVTIQLESNSGNPTQVSRSAVAKYEKDLGGAVDFASIEQSIESEDFVKIARVRLRPTIWAPNYPYVRGAFVRPAVDNGRVYEMSKILYFSGPVEPVFPVAPNASVVDKNLRWVNCGTYNPVCDVVNAWTADTAYEVGAQVIPTVANGFKYCLTEVFNLSNSSNEQQRILFSSVPTSGTWRLEYGPSETTTDLAFNANAAAVAAALNALVSLSTTQVTGNYVSGFTVNFVGADGNRTHPQLALNSAGRNEINCIALDLNPNVGAWSLNFGVDTTAPLAFNITLSQLKSALEALPSIGVGNVDVIAGVSGEDYRVVFQGTLGLRNLTTQLTVNSNSLFAATPVTPIVTETVQGESPNSGTNEQQKVVFSLSPTAGSFRLDFNGNSTALLPFSVSASAVQSALEALLSVGAGNVFVTGTVASGFTITFQNTLGAQNVPLITIPANTLVQGVDSVNITVQTLVPGVLPFAGTDEVQSLAFPFVPDSGTFVLLFSSQSTSPLPFNVTPLQLQTVLNNLSNLSGVTVTGSVTLGFIITFAGADGKQNQPLLSVINNTLAAASAPVTIAITVCQEGASPAQNIRNASNNPVTVTTQTVVDGVNPEPDWTAGVGLAGICP